MIQMSVNSPTNLVNYFNDFLCSLASEMGSGVTCQVNGSYDHDGFVHIMLDSYRWVQRLMENETEYSQHALFLLYLREI